MFTEKQPTILHNTALFLNYCIERKTKKDPYTAHTHTQEKRKTNENKYRLS